jgi:small subunit ribosomal protein S20
MPVTKSAKRALRTATRRHTENLETKEVYKNALKNVRKAAASGAEGLSGLLSIAQSALDRAAKKHSIHPNKASRLKSRMAKKAVGIAAAPEKTVKKATKAAAPKKAAPKKAAAKKK